MTSFEEGHVGQSMCDKARTMFAVGCKVYMQLSPIEYRATMPTVVIHFA